MNMQAMLKQAQQMQKQMEEAKKEIDNSSFSSTQGGVVTVVMFGTKKISSIEINDEAMSDKEMLQDLMLLAVNDCVNQIEKYSEEKMSVFGAALGGLM